MGQFTIEPATPWLPEGLRHLEAEAKAQSVNTLLRRWLDKSERYGRPGESLLVAVEANGAVIGVGGLTVCPDLADALRVRRFYVANEWRRRGVATALATQLIQEGLHHVELLSCNAGASAAAPPFWEALGFQPTHQAGVTHTLRAGGRGHPFRAASSPSS